MRSLLFGLVALLLCLPEAHGQTISVDKLTDYQGTLTLQVGEAKVVSLTNDVRRITLTANGIVEPIAVTSRQLVLTGLKAGKVVVVLYDKSDIPSPLVVEVAQNFSGLESQIKKAYPSEKISISANGDRLVLSGSVSDSRMIDEIESIALLYTDSVVNLLRPSGGQQVQLEIKFAEVSRTALREVGFSGFAADAAGQNLGGIFGNRIAGGTFNPTFPGGPVAGLPAVSPDGTRPPSAPIDSFSGAFHFIFSSASALPISFTLDLLNSQGLSRTLAEPTLVAMSGQKAKFLAGGEFPIFAGAGGLGAAAQIDFKEFGIVMEFSPIVLGKGIMQLSLNAEVSDLDFGAGINQGGVTIPGLTARRGETTVRLRDGESFAIAGLLSDRVKQLFDKVPLLGDLPILGTLFRSSSYRHEETELLVVITPHLVEALPSMPELPGQRLSNNPSDLEFFLFGAGLRSSDELLPVQNGTAPATTTEGAAPAAAQPKNQAVDAAMPAGLVGFVH